VPIPVWCAWFGRAKAAFARTTAESGRDAPPHGWPGRSGPNTTHSRVWRAPCSDRDRCKPRILELPVAIVHKTRLTGRRVEVHEVVGDVKGKSCIIVDDLISTGGTIEAAAAALRARGAKDELTVVATHALLAGDALDVLARARVTRLIATDTVPRREGGRLERKTVSVGPLLADAIRRLSSDRSASHVTA
jgi:ribose-phosphate pyrophosphokinase